MKNTVITISRQFGSGGKNVGEKLSKTLNIPFYDKEIITKSSEDSGISESFFENAENTGISSLLYGLSTTGTYFDLPIDVKVYLAQSKTIKDIASKGSCIFVGRCANYVLKSKFDLLNVFVYASLEDRIKRISKLYSLSGREAKDLINKTDKKKENYYQHFTGNKFGNFENFNLCLDSGFFGIDETVKIIKDTYEKLGAK